MTQSPATLFLRRNFLRIVGGGAALAAIVFLAAVYVFDRYVATAALIAETGCASLCVENVVQSARAKSFHGALVDTLHLAADGEFAGASVAHAIDTLAARLTVARRGDSGVIDVFASTRSAEKCARIANAAARKIVEESSALEDDGGPRARRLTALRARIERAERSAADLTTQLKRGGSRNAERGDGGLAGKFETVNQLEREARELRDIHQKLLSEPEDHGRDKAAHVRILSLATAPTERTPRRIMLAAASALLGLLGGIGGALARERRRDALATTPQATSLGARTIVFAPLLDVAAAREATPDLTPWLGEICAALAPTGARRQARVILVASAHRGDGRTTIAVNLATWFATGSDRTLLIEADRPRAARKRARHGLLDVLTSGEDLRGALIRPGDDAYTLLPFGGRADAAVGPLMTGLTMRALLKLARRWFDVVIIDGPPALEVDYARALAAQADAVAFVACWNRTAGADARAAFARLDVSRAAFLYNQADAGRLRLHEPAQAQSIVARAGESGPGED